MTDWLDPVRAALDGRQTPVHCFLRDDDGGWDDPALHRLVDRVEDRGLVLDIAVIPSVVDEASAAALSRRVDDGSALVHQHGWAHVNHAVTGRKGEFGSERGVDALARDLAAGRRRMAELFGDRSQAIFTPPWNRCAREAAECLPGLGVRVLSREAGAEPFAVDGLAEVPVTFDWFAKRKGVALDRHERGRVLAEQVATRAVVGVMLHHAVTDADELREVDRLLALLATSPAVVPTTIGDVAGLAASA